VSKELSNLDYLDSTWEPEKNLKKMQDFKDKIKMRASFKQKNLKRTFRKYLKEMYIEYELKQEKLNVREGSFKNGDSPIKVLGNLFLQVLGIRRNNGEIYCKVSWNKKGDEPVEDSLIKSELLTEICPKILCDYYETHLKFTKSKRKIHTRK